MTNESMRATLGRKFITHTGLEHPEQLRTPHGSRMIEMLETPSCSARRTHCGSELDQVIEYNAQIAELLGDTWGARCGYEALRQTAHDLRHFERYGTHR